MKNIIAFFLLLLSSSQLFSQADQRTLSTKIADLLARMPAQNKQELQTNMENMASLGEEGWASMILMLSEPGKGDNTALEYALGGFSWYVTQPGKEELRIAAAKAYGTALATISGRESKAFVIRQLEITGDDYSVAALKNYLTDDSLADPAARALVSIHTAAAGRALLDALGKATGKNRLTLAEALGDIRYTGASSYLASLIKPENAALNKTVLYALAQTGLPASQPVLANAAKASGYTYDITNASSDYIVYLNQLAADGNKETAEKAALALLKKCAAVDQMPARTAALKLITALQGEKSVPLLIDAMKDNDPEYRAAALEYSLPFTGDAAMKSWTDRLKTADEIRKAEIITMLGNSEKPAAFAAVAKALEDPAVSVRLAAIKASRQTGEGNALPVLLEFIKKANPEEIEAIKKQILVMKGQAIAETLGAAIVNTPGVPAKAALIDVLGSRGDAGRLQDIWPYLQSRDTLVRTAAFNALPGLSGPGALPQLFPLLIESSNPSEISAVQQAVIAGASGIRDSSHRADPVLESMKKAPHKKQPLYYNILAGIGGQAGVTPVATAFNNGDAQVKERALQALSSWPDASAAPILWQIASQTNNQYTSPALDGYIRLLSAANYAPEEKLVLLRQAMELPYTGTARKKVILQELTKCRIFPALLYAGAYLDSAALQHEAAFTVFTIAQSGTKWNEYPLRALLEKSMPLLTGPDGDYQRKAIQKYLAEMPLPQEVKPYTLSEEEKNQGFHLLFDGFSMDQWTGNTTDYVIENGTIAVHPKNGEHGNLYTKSEFSDFVYRFEFRLTPGANNGIGIRAPLEGDAAYVGMEIQVLDNEAPIYRNLHEYQYHGSVYGVIAARRGFLKPTGEWNEEEITAKGNKIKVVLNGTTILDGDIGPAIANGTLDGKDHPGLKNKKGHIGFLGHGDVLWFRHMRVKELTGINSK